MEKIKKIVWSVKSECGPVRKKNEDSVFPDISGSGFVPFKAGVFDGMGGHRKGEVASELASSVMEENYENLISYVEKANRAIYEYQEKNKEEEMVELFAQNIIEAGKIFLDSPSENPNIPTWRRVDSADPTILKSFNDAVMEDNS